MGRQLLVGLLSGFGGALIAGVIALTIHRQDRQDRRAGEHDRVHAALEAKFDVQVARLSEDLNGIGRKLAGIEGIVSALLEGSGIRDPHFIYKPPKGER